MADADAGRYRDAEAAARYLAEHAQTHSEQLIHLKAAERYGGLALDAEQNILVRMPANRL